MDEAYFKLAVWLNDRGKVDPNNHMCVYIFNISYFPNRKLPPAVEI